MTYRLLDRMLIEVLVLLKNFGKEHVSVLKVKRHISHTNTIKQ